MNAFGSLNTFFVCSLLESSVISTSAAIAPANTIMRGWRIAIIAAMKNVLSPNSENKIIEMVSTKACKNETSPKRLLLSLLLLFASTVLIVSILFIEGKCFCEFWNEKKKDCIRDKVSIANGGAVGKILIVWFCIACFHNPAIIKQTDFNQSKENETHQLFGCTIVVIVRYIIHWLRFDITIYVVYTIITKY